MRFRRFFRTLPVVTALLGVAALMPVVSFAEEKPTTNIGDIDLDGSRSAEDIRMLSGYLHGKNVLSGDAALNADMNGDGEVDIFDLGLLKHSVIQETAGNAEFSPVIRKDVTASADPLLWNNVCLPADAFASVQTFVLNDPEELQKAMDGLQDAVQRSLLKTYDAAFFRDNVLILHYGYQFYEPYTTEITDISYQDDMLTVTAGQQPCEGRAKGGIEIWQIAVPRSQYNGNGVKWVAKDTEYINAGYDSFPMYASGMEPKDDFASAFGKEGVVVRDFDALKELSEKLFAEKGAEALQKKYPESFFEKKAVWFCQTTNVLTDHSLWQARKVGDTVYADIRVSESFGDIADYFLHAVTFDKDIDAAHFQLHQVTLSPYPELSGRIACFDGMGYDTALLVNTYSFGDEHEITFYWAHHVGNVPYAAREKFASCAVAEDCSDFNQPYEELSVIREETMVDDVRVWRNDAEGYAIVLEPDGVTIHFLKSKSTGEEESITVSYPKSQY